MRHHHQREQPRQSGWEDKGQQRGLLSLALLLRVNALDPGPEGGQDERAAEQAESGHVHADGHVAIGGRQQVEKEGLVEALQKVVEAAEDALDHAPDDVEIRRLAAAAAAAGTAHTLNRHGLDAKAVEQAVVAARYAGRLL